MREAKLGEVLENAVRLAGRDVSVNVIPPDWKVLAAAAINAGISELAAEKFPIMMRVEYRRYRPTWEGNAAWRRGMQCWHGEDYWELMTEESTGEPGVAACWRRLKMEELMAFVNWDQPWEALVMDAGSVDRTRFAYSADPRYNPHATPVKVVGMSEMGVELQSPAPKGVYCRFVPEFPRVSFDDWVSGREYDAGEVVYLQATKDVYQCVKDVRHPEEGSTDPDPTVQAPNVNDACWTPVRIPDPFFYFMIKRVAPDIMQESQGKYQTQAAAEAEFNKLCERYHEGVGETTVRRGRFM